MLVRKILLQNITKNIIIKVKLSQRHLNRLGSNFTEVENV